jgi:integrase
MGRHIDSRTEADAEADRLRTAIRTDTFRRGAPSATTPAGVQLTFGDVAEAYLERRVRVPGRRPGPIRAIENYIRIIRGVYVLAGGRLVAFETRPMSAITKPEIEAVREDRRAQLRAVVERYETARLKDGRPGRIALPGVKGGEVGIEHLMATVRHIFDWALGEGYIERTPFKRNGRTVIQVRTQKKIHRRRRLDPEANEEQRLLRAACPKGRREGMDGHLHDLIVAALETGCRKGELLSLQWDQVKSENGLMRYIELPADKTKTNDPRIVPITERLRAVLEYRRFGTDGRELPLDAYVFGNEVGERVGRVYTAWRATCRRAGIVGLTFHDLRHEFISRMLDAGVPIHKVRDWAGHRNIATTGIYANTTLSHLDEARRQFEEHRAVCTNVAQMAGSTARPPLEANPALPAKPYTM